MIGKQFKNGDWFTMWGMIFKIFSIGMFTTFAYQMIKTDDDYVEGDKYQFDSDLVMFNAEKYKPYQEENADEEETV